MEKTKSSEKEKSSKKTKGKEKMQLIIGNKRTDGRGFDELRPISMTAGVLQKADGSASIEWGKNKIIAAVYGPREVFPKHISDPYKAVIECRYSMAPFSSIEEHSRTGPNRRSIEIGKIARHVFDNVVLANQFPNTKIDISMEVLQSDGGTRVAAITAAALALADAGIPMKDVVCGVSVGKADGHLVVDLNKYEDNLGSSDVPAVVSLRTGELLLFQMDGMLTREEMHESIEKIFVAAGEVSKLQAAALKKRYEEIESKMEENAAALAESPAPSFEEPAEGAVGIEGNGDLGEGADAGAGLDTRDVGY
jgi:exosome complex component RRP41